MENIDKFIKYLESKVNPLHNSLNKVIKKKKCDEAQIKRLNSIIDEKVFDFVNEKLTEYKINNGLNEDDYKYLKNRIISSDLFNYPILHSFEIEDDYKVIESNELSVEASTEEITANPISEEISNEIVEKEEINTILDMETEDVVEHIIETVKQIDEKPVNNEQKIEEITESIEEILEKIEKISDETENLNNKIEEKLDNLEKLI